jgi:hypothetical protein
MSLPPFPTDAETLALVDAALDTAPTGRTSLGELLAIMSGVDLGDRTAMEPVAAGGDGEPRVMFDPRVYYSPHDVIRALVAEVRALRAATGGAYHAVVSYSFQGKARNGAVTDWAELPQQGYGEDESRDDLQFARHVADVVAAALADRGEAVITGGGHSNPNRTPADGRAPDHFTITVNRVAR